MHGPACIFCVDLTPSSPKATADAAHGIEGASVVTAMGFSCREFGIRVSGLGDEWFVGPHAQVGQWAACMECARFASDSSFS
jgi:hypothetical protein